MVADEALRDARFVVTAKRAVITSVVGCYSKTTNGFKRWSMFFPNISDNTCEILTLDSFYQLSLQNPSKRDTVVLELGSCAAPHSWLSLLCLADSFRETNRTCLWSFVVISFYLMHKNPWNVSPIFGTLWRFVLINRIRPTLILEFTTAGGGQFIAPIRAVPLAIAEPALGDAAVGAGAAEEPRSARHWAWGGKTSYYSYFLKQKNGIHKILKQKVHSHRNSENWESFDDW